MSDVQDSISAGRRLSDELLERRGSGLRARAAALGSGTRSGRGGPEAAPAIPEATRRNLGPAGSDLLIAEGDSWFDYPFHDVLSELEDEHGFECETVAHKGDRVEDMAYSGGQLDKFIRLLDKCLRRGEVPRAILLSGGGNDIAGDEFHMLLEHARSPRPGLNDAVVAAILDIRLRNAYAHIIGAVTRVCEQRLERKLPILIHGYDRPVPDGRGYAGGWWFLPGPWLEPGFRAKGYGRLAANTVVMGQLIDRFNGMLSQLVAEPGLDHVTHVDLRGTLSNDASYREDWGNELHPSKSGFRLVASRIAATIRAPTP